MILQSIVEHFGSQKNMADALGVTEGAVSQWVKDGALPSLRAIQIEELTDGEFKARELPLAKGLWK